MFIDFEWHWILTGLSFMILIGWNDDCNKMWDNNTCEVMTESVDVKNIWKRANVCRTMQCVRKRLKKRMVHQNIAWSLDLMVRWIISRTDVSVRKNTLLYRDTSSVVTADVSTKSMPKKYKFKLVKQWFSKTGWFPNLQILKYSEIFTSPQLL